MEIKNMTGMFSRRHYVKIADIFKRQYLHDREIITLGEKDRIEQTAMEQRTFNLMNTFIKMFSDDNERFDKEKFLKHIYGEI